MLKNFGKLVKGLVIMTVASSILNVSTVSADNSLARKVADYTAISERSVGAYFQTADVNSNTEKSVVSVSNEPIAFSTVTMESDELLKGETKISQKGVDGTKKVTYVSKYVNGEVANILIEEEVVTSPVDEIVLVGTKVAVNTLPSVTDVKYKTSLTMNATAYCPCSKCCGKWANGYTANGMKADYGVVAVDPSVIPLGTKLYVEGYGYCVAADTGGAIKGNRIDLCYASHSAALNSGFGHKSVNVYILG